MSQALCRGGKSTHGHLIHWIWLAGLVMFGNLVLWKLGIAAHQTSHKTQTAVLTCENLQKSGSCPLLPMTPATLGGRVFLFLTNSQHNLCTSTKGFWNSNWILLVNPGWPLSVPTVRNLTSTEAARAMHWPSDWLELWLGMISTLGFKQGLAWLCDGCVWHYVTAILSYVWILMDHALMKLCQHSCSFLSESFVVTVTANFSTRKLPRQLPGSQPCRCRWRQCIPGRRSKGRSAPAGRQGCPGAAGCRPGGGTPWAWCSGCDAVEGSPEN